MRWLVLFENSPEVLWGQAARGSEHLDYLQRNSDCIKIASGLHGTSDGAISGGFWILQADDRSTAVDLIESDPFYVPEHRHYRLRSWDEAFSLDVEAA